MITEEELIALQSTKFSAAVLQLKADTAAVESGRALAEAKASGLEYENTLLKIYIKYGLTDKHIISEVTGQIQLKEENDNPKDDQENGTNERRGGPPPQTPRSDEKIGDD